LSRNAEKKKINRGKENKIISKGNQKGIEY
jgi:hypothetical protein